MDKKVNLLVGRTGVSPKLAAEIDAKARETYSQNLGSDGIWSVNLSEVTPEEILERSRLNPSQLNLNFLLHFPTQLNLAEKVLNSQKC